MTAGDLKQLCKSFELVLLEDELKKNTQWTEVLRGYSCINFIVGVVETIGNMDVGYFPEVKLELPASKKPFPFNDCVKPFMAYIAAHPEQEKEGAAATLVLSLMEAKILIPAHWVLQKDREK